MAKRIPNRVEYAVTFEIVNGYLCRVIRDTTTGLVVSTKTV